MVVAGGRGARFGKPYNKVFFPLEGRSILSRCLDALSAPGLYEGIVLVLSASDRADYLTLTGREGACPLVRGIADGGENRQQSVYNGLLMVPENVEYVAIHDAARPFVSPAVLRLTLEGAAQYGACVPGMPVTDTIKVLEKGFSVSTPPREALCAVQTPQVFRREEILALHERARREGCLVTDDASLYEKYTGKVYVAMHSDCGKNIKVTTPQDVEKALPDFRTGTGFDAHRLAEGRELILCGVQVPCEKGLMGHSDADVATHALMDALLGAAALGDIGKHFPDSDEAYRGISSLKLLARVRQLLAEQGFKPANVDVTIVAQRPKLSPFIPQMRENLAKTLGLPLDRVSVKATTTEHMGYEGEGIGISAQAAALIYRS